MSFVKNISQHVVTIDNPFALTDLEQQAIMAMVRRCNSVIYQVDPERYSDKAMVRALAAQLSLHTLDDNLCADGDGITALQVGQSTPGQGYIPYTDKALNWHTDGYYNDPSRTVRAIVMHCVQDAANGGDNQFLDPEILYILLRDANPAWIAALMAEDVLVIPPNEDAGKVIRPAQAGPVFSLLDGCDLHMRYTIRKRHVQWKQTPDVQAALQFIASVLESGREYIYHIHLLPGQGIISNNVLHTRSAFVDAEHQQGKRLLYRARFFERIGGTAMSESPNWGDDYAVAK